ncbi:MAG TPA: hypothetical protein DCP91_08915 [Eggerthellaceae bacterium]|nr:hypothetical protein [Eggerthellaceae bacterium]
MLTYTFSRREKVLILVLAIVIVAIVWFMLVYQRTTNEIARMDGEIAQAQSEATVATAQVSRMHTMQSVIDRYKEAGVQPTPMPDFDNMTMLMTELNRIMAMADTYTLSFDDLDSETSNEYVLRGVRADFGAPSIASAESIVAALAQGEYPCSIDSVAIADRTVRTSSRVSGSAGSSTVSASVHITFFEKKPR